MIYFTSDLHLCHDKEFLYVPRGFTNIEDHNKTIIENWQNTVNPEDDVYVLGDLMLKDNDTAMSLLKTLKGKIHIILGNHDTDNRIELYKTLPNVIDIQYATIIKYNGYRFYLSHYPSMTSSLEKENLKQCLINLYGHTHQQSNFFNEMPFIYHVGLDSHNNKLVSVDEVIEDIQQKYLDCIKEL